MMAFVLTARFIASLRRLRILEVPVRMRGRETGESSITALRSLYYAIKVTLALFVGIFRRRVVPLEEN